MDKEHLKRTDKDLWLNYFFIDFDYKHNAQDLLRAYAHFFNELGRLEFTRIYLIGDLVKNIEQLSNDRIEAAIISTKESDRHFTSFLDEKEKEQQNMEEIDKATTEYSVEIKKPTPPAVPSEDDIKKKEIGTLPDLPEPETIVIDTDSD